MSAGPNPLQSAIHKGQKRSSNARATSSNRLWLAGSASTLCGAALAPTAHGETVQINQTNNRIAANTSGVFQFLTQDLTGDGAGDFGPIFDFGGKASIGTEIIRFQVQLYNTSSSNRVAYAKVDFLGVTSYYAFVTGVPVASGTTPPREAIGFINVQFTDSRINGGSTTDGVIEVRARSIPQAAEIAVLRIIFDDESTVRPTGLNQLTQYPKWVDPVAQATRAAKIASLKRMISKAKKQLHRARKSGNRNKIRAAKKKLKKLKAQLRNV